MSDLSSILTLILLVSGTFLMSMVGIFVLFGIKSEISPCGQPLLVSIHENAYFTKFVCSGVIVSKDHMIALSQCFSDHKGDEVKQESFQITSGSDFWYGGTNIHRIMNTTKVDSFLCIKVTPPFPSCAYGGGKILISDPQQANNTYSVKGWGRNWAPYVIMRNLNSTEECIDAPGALVMDQNNRLLGFQGVKCIWIGGSMIAKVYYFKDLIDRDDSCTNKTFTKEYYNNSYHQ